MAAEPTKRAGKPNRAEIARRRDLEVMQLRLAGASFRDIGEQLGFANHTGALKAYHRAMDRSVAESVDEMRATEGERLDRLQRAHWAKAIAGDAKATDRVLRIMDQRAKLFGMNAPTAVYVARSEVDVEIAQLVATLEARAATTEPPGADVGSVEGE